jgi:hypothetical protein
MYFAINAESWIMTSDKEKVTPEKLQVTKKANTTRNEALLQTKSFPYSGSHVIEL